MVGSSLDTNPPNADRHITSGGSDWLWAVFAIMLLADLVMIFWSFRRPRGTRLFHQIAIVILTTSTIAYFSMASDLGSTPIRAGSGRNTTITRQIWYVRYIQWFITIPLLLLELLLATGLSLSDIFTTLFMGWVLVICGLVGALVATAYKWGYFVFGILALFYIWSVLLGHGPRSNFAAGGVVRSGFVRGSGYFSFLLLLYPICWALSEGRNVISPNAEMIWYGILDILAGPVLLLGFLWSLRSIDYGTFGLRSTKYSDGAYGNGASEYGTGAGAGTGPHMTNNGVGTTGTAYGTGHTGPTTHNGVGTHAGGPGVTGANRV